MNIIHKMVTDLRYSLGKLFIPDKGKKTRQVLKDTWSKESTADRDFSQIVPYFELTAVKDEP